MELVSEKEAGYRFHYMDRNRDLICRWDSAPHHKEISSFPYHLHTKKRVEESRRMRFIDVLDIVTEMVIDNLEFD